MKKLLAFVMCLVLLIVVALGQSPYQLKTGRELGLSGVGIGLVGTGFLLERQIDPLTVAQLSELRAGQLTDFERWVTTRRSVRSHKASNVLLTSSQLFPIVLTLADKKMHKDIGTIGAMYGQAAFLNFGLTSVVKATAKRTRPYAYRTELPLEERMTIEARQSFWSGHTSQTATMCFLTAQLYADYHPDSRWRPVMWSAAATIPAVTGVLRMTAGKHFPTDVLLGYVTGAAIGIILPRIHRRMNE